MTARVDRRLAFVALSLFPLLLTGTLAASAPPVNGISDVDVAEAELLSRAEPVTFFLILFALAAIGGIGKLMMAWDDRRPWVNQVGQALFSMFSAAVVAFYGWKRFDPYTNMVMAALAAPFFDVALGWLKGRVFLGPTTPKSDLPPSGKETEA